MATYINVSFVSLITTPATSVFTHIQPYSLIRPTFLFYLLKSQERSQEVVNRLRSSQTYEHYSVQTEKFRKSFIPFSVNNILSVTLYLVFYVVTIHGTLSNIYVVLSVLYCVTFDSIYVFMYCVIQPIGCNTIKLIHSFRLTPALVNEVLQTFTNVFLTIITLPPGRVQSVVMRLYLSLLSHISKTAWLNFTKFPVHVQGDCGWLLLRR